MVLLIRLLFRLLIRSVSMLSPSSPVSLLPLRCDWCADQPDQPDQGERDWSPAVCRYVATLRLGVHSLSGPIWAYSSAISLISLSSLIHVIIRSCGSYGSICRHQHERAACTSRVWHRQQCDFPLVCSLFSSDVYGCHLFVTKVGCVCHSVHLLLSDIAPTSSHY